MFKDYIVFILWFLHSWSSMNRNTQLIKVVNNTSRNQTTEPCLSGKCMKSKPRKGKTQWWEWWSKLPKILWGKKIKEMHKKTTAFSSDLSWFRFMTILVLIFKTSSTLFLCSPSPKAASSTKMGSHIESYASISLCFILAYRASSLWTTFPTSHCKHTKSALLLWGNRSLPHSEWRGALF